MNRQELIDRSEEASQLLALLANPHRLRVLCELQKGEQPVSALEKLVGLSQSALSQHLAKLREGGIVSTRREAQSIYYSVTDDRAAKVLAVLADIFCPPAPPSKQRSR